MAIKDNIAVAGIPMMNGSRAVEGFIPGRDATVVQRLLDAGAIIAGKSVCEDLCCSGPASLRPAGRCATRGIRRARRADRLAAARRS
ncbi:amidase family protein [Mycobacterium xenopi 4042]|uniref:Amidase family protein n=1 Tax=Mycobacterium xenopi 4042 TaxID=1299334 RepID=X8AH86_MYCXE|nr:amidase family protein [Mycobacterium xenopi 4042]